MAIAAAIEDQSEMENEIRLLLEAITTSSKNSC
jgi:hypothetical protein